jgi:hypothetical protein
VTAPHAYEIIAGYLTRLEAALVPVPDVRRRELLEDVRAHIAEARSALPDETDADVLNILDRLGDPADMAAAEIGRVEPVSVEYLPQSGHAGHLPQPVARGGSQTLEIVAIVLLLLFWPVGVVLLWMSDAWTTRDKLIGTLVPPGGYLGVLVIGPIFALGTFGTACQTISDDFGRVISSTCPSAGAQTGIDVALAFIAITYVVGPIFSAAYLAARLRRIRRAASPTIRHDAAPPMVIAAGGL